MQDERLAREKSFHDERFGHSDDFRSVTGKYYSIKEEPRALYRHLALEGCARGSLLEFGCATGDQSLWWLEGGASVTGIDISSAAISRAKSRWKGTPHESRSEYLEMNAESLEFDDDTFDVIVGNGIIHHLNLDLCYREIARVLKPGGRAVFMEPMGHNPLINLYRKLTPDLRTADEHPLKEQDINLARKYFDSVQSTPFHLFTLLAVPFRRRSVFEPLLKFLANIDRVVFRIPVLRRQAWFCVLIFKEPLS